MKKKFLAMMIAVTILFSLAGVGTMAWFTSQAASTAAFQAGTLEIEAGGGEGTIANFTIQNLQPSFNYEAENDRNEPPQYAYEPEKGYFDLINKGSLSSKVYRLTVENVRQNNLTGEPVSDALFNDFLKKLYVAVTAKAYDGVEDDILYVGSLYKMIYDNGGYFDPFIFMNQGDNRKVEFAVALHKSAGNEFQKLGLKADFTIHAMQVEEPLPGEENPTQYAALYSGQNFSLKAREEYHTDVYNSLDPDVGFNGYGYTFQFNETQKTFKSMELELRHESDNNHDVKVTRVLLVLDRLTELEGLNRKDVDYKEVLGSNNKYIYIKKDAFSSDWKLVNVRATYTNGDNSVIDTEWVPYFINAD
ncbi:TasA family protein [Lutispora sp.]|uniref:TasA family protein n=1 Tax=Lutispora sp. TaxID=2828727 RepID=UPI002B20DC97|nr:TasA family protein [Lutispora sp.]MEA4963354.1 TasA family protein [Lutispora sp.]